MSLKAFVKTFGENINVGSAKEREWLQKRENNCWEFSNDILKLVPKNECLRFCGRLSKKKKGLIFIPADETLPLT